MDRAVGELPQLRLSERLKVAHPAEEIQGRRHFSDRAALGGGCAQA